MTEATFDATGPDAAVTPERKRRPGEEPPGSTASESSVVPEAA